ncbi:MAG: DNRLRE domain-containing protein [Clostridiaceae bacterium]|nr:DNRLRE domain-containing protein [Clostridiaceae bacterium]
MKSRRINYFKYFSLFFAMIVLVLVAGCSGPTPTTPIINSFLANPTSITVGESSNLSWSVTDATTVVIDQSVGSVASTGTTAVSPVTNTTYTLTATNVAGSVTASVTVTVGAAFGSIDINSNPDGAKVYLDGVDTGQVTPIILTNIDAGSHIIKLDKYHYKVWEDTAVTVNANQTTYLNPPLTYAATQYITLQPGAVGKDAAISSSIPTNNFGNETYSWVGDFSGIITRLYIQFNLSSVPANARIVDADLLLYQYITFGGSDFTIELLKINNSWDESTVSWDLQPTRSSDPIITSSITAGATTWNSWDIDDLVQSWLDGGIANYGANLKDTHETSGNTMAYFYTSDYTIDTTKRPKLVISYYIP